MEKGSANQAGTSTASFQEYHITTGSHIVKNQCYVCQSLLLNLIIPIMNYIPLKTNYLFVFVILEQQDCSQAFIYRQLKSVRLKVKLKILNVKPIKAQSNFVSNNPD